MFITERILSEVLREKMVHNCDDLDNAIITITGKDLHELINYVNSFKSKKTIDINEVFEVSCAYFNVDPEKIKSRTRKRTVCLPRQMIQAGIYFVFNIYPSFTKTNIGLITGDRDHTTVCHSENTIKDLCDTDDNFKNTYYDFINFLEQKKLNNNLIDEKS